MEKTEHSSRFWMALVIFSLVGQIAWVMENMYFNVFIYKMFGASAQAISGMVAASAVAATATTLLIGALSDKLGKRKIFICAGYILWGISILSFSLIRVDIIGKLFPLASAASVGVSLTIIMDCVMTFFGSAANDACFNAWLTDSTNETNRGAAEGINSMMPLLAILVVFGGFMGLDLGERESWTTIFTIIGTLVLVLGVAGFRLIREPVLDTRGNENYFRNLLYGFRPSVVKANPQLYLALLAYAVFGIAIQIFMPYLILYYTVTLGMDNYVVIFAPAIVLAAAFTFFYGKQYDKRGFRAAVVVPLGMLMAGFLLLWYFRATVPVFFGSLVMMCGYLAGMAMFGAILRDKTPAGKAGMFQGLRIVGQVLIPGVIGPAIGAAVLRGAETVLNDDGTTSFIPNRNIFLAAFLAACFLWIVLIPLFQRLGKEKRHAA